MLLKRFAMASLVGSATILAGCGRPATLAATVPAQIQPDVSRANQSVAAPAQSTGANAAPVVEADLQLGAPTGEQAADPAQAQAADGAPGPTEPVVSEDLSLENQALAAGQALASDQALATGQVPADGQTLAEGQAGAPGGVSAQWWFFFGPKRPTPPPIYTPPTSRPTPPPIYTPPPARPTPPPVSTNGSRVYGTVGNASVDLARVTGSENISGRIDGRSTYLTVATGRLSGSIGSSSNVYLTRNTGYLFLPTNISGSVGNRSLSLNISGRNTYGSIGSVYFDTTISSDDRTLTGRYGGSPVSVRTSGSTTSGFLGNRSVTIFRANDGSLSGYVGTSRIDLSGDIGPGGLLRRLPLIASDGWLVFSTLTKFFI